MQNIDFGTRSLLNTTAYCGQATTVRWSWSSCSAEYGLPPESKSFAAAQYSVKSLIICLDSSAEEDRARMQPCTRRLDFLGQVEQLTGMSLARKKGHGSKKENEACCPPKPIDTSYKI